MRQIALGARTAPNVVLGLMRISEMDDDAIRDLVHTAREVGIDFFDHADIYGTTLHQSERRFAEAMRLSSSERAEITLQTKAGIVPARGCYDFSYDHLVGSVEASLTALHTDYVDVLLLHRPDALVEPDEVARAFDHLYDSGKVRAFGVSNHTPRQIDLLQRWVRQPLIANQIQLSVAHATIIAEGVAMNTDGPQAVVRDGGGVVEYSRLEGITIQAWSPMQGAEGIIEGNPAYADLNAAAERLAAAYDVPVSAILTAWITRHPAGMQVVLGTTSPQRVADAAKGSEIPLTRAEWYELFRAAGHVLP